MIPRWLSTEGAVGASTTPGPTTGPTTGTTSSPTTGTVTGQGRPASARDRAVPAVLLRLLLPAHHLVDPDGRER